MSYGEIYKSTWWGNVCDSTTYGTIYRDIADCSGSGGFTNSKSVYYINDNTNRAISVTKNPFEVGGNEQFVIMAWIKPDASMFTGSSYDQRMIVDLSSNIFSTADGKGYSIFMRKTSAGNVTMNWFFKRTGQTRVNSSCIVNLNNYSSSLPMLVVASVYSINANSLRVQNLRVYQNGINANNYVDVEKNYSPTSMSYTGVGQDLVFGNTSDAGQSAQAFRGNIDEVSLWVLGNSASTDSYQGLGDRYFNNNSPRLDLSQDPLYSLITGWYRFGDNFTVNNGVVTFPNASNGSGADALAASQFSTSFNIRGNIV
jgi:hypothetical protein